MLGLALLATACGARELRTGDHDDYRAIQREEARLANGRAVATDEDEPCTRRVEAKRVACSAAENVCAIARDLDDLDASARCDRATRLCDETTANVQARCPEESR